jgi:hypothetical protein
MQTPPPFCLRPQWILQGDSLEGPEMSWPDVGVPTIEVEVPTVDGGVPTVDVAMM